MQHEKGPEGSQGEAMAGAACSAVVVEDNKILPVN